jgi:hypothetical protein
MATETLASHRVTQLHPTPPVSALHEDVNRIVRGAYDAGFKKGQASTRTDGRDDRSLTIGVILGFAIGVTVSVVVAGFIMSNGAPL